MGRFSWRKIILFVLILTILLGASGCWGSNNQGNTKRELTTLPDRIVNAFTNLLGGLRDIGGALANQMGNMVKNIIGR